MAYSSVEVGTQSGANGNTVTTSNTSLDSVIPGSGNTTTFSNATPYISSVFVRAAQASTITNLNVWDWGSAVTDPGWCWNMRFQNTPSTTSNFGRLFDGVNGAGTNLVSYAITSTGKLQVVETGPNQSVSSTGTLLNGTWYTFVERYVASSGAYSISAYVQGSTTATATVTMTMATGYSFRSRRVISVGTASSGFGYIDGDFAKFEVGAGGVPTRPDVTLAAPTVTPDADKDVVASASVSVHASASVSGDLINSFTGVLTAPAGVTTPALSGTATGTGTTSANLTQTFTPSVAGWYTWTPTATGSTSGLSNSAVAQKVYVSPVIGDPVPLRSATTNGYTNVGGAASIAAAQSDNNDATYAESPSTPTAANYVDYFYGPYGASGITYTPKLVKVGADPMTVTVELRKSNGSGVATGPALYTATPTVTTSPSSPTITVDGTALAALSTSDRREVCWRVYGVV